MREERLSHKIRTMKKYDPETEEETEEEATLLEKFDYLLDLLDDLEGGITSNSKNIDRTKEQIQQHRHGVGNGLYSGKGEP